jgi:hypothetical protein
MMEVGKRGSVIEAEEKAMGSLHQPQSWILCPEGAVD